MCDVVFYDGGCGLCHRSVVFLMRRDGDGSRFLFAPLGGVTAAERLGVVLAAGLPDSLVVCTGGGAVLVRSSAALYALGRLGGVWRLLAWLLGVVPTGWRDGVYGWVALRRHRWFPRPGSACPVVPAELRGRFLL